MADQAKDPRKLCIMNVKETDEDEQIRSMCDQFGTLIHFNRPLKNKNLAFPLYADASDAQRARENLIAKGYRVEYANARVKGDNTSEDGIRPKYDEFRSTRNTSQRGSQQTLDPMENGCVEADSTVHLTNQPYGKCLRCGDKAYHNCGRCGDFYCSEECQASDWLKHKRECFPMPKLVPAKSTYSLHASNGNSTETVKSPQADQQKLPTTPPLPKPVPASFSSKPGSTTSDVVPISGKPSNQTDAENMVPSPRARLLAQTNGVSPSQPVAAVVQAAPAPTCMEVETIPNETNVFITYVKSHQAIYVRSAAKDDEFKMMVTEVERASRVSPKLTVYPSRNDIVMAPYDGAYYRAMVINSDKKTGTVNVGFIDFGNSNEVLFNQLKQLPNELRDHRRMTTVVFLKGIQNEFEQNEIDLMTSHLQNLCNSETAVKIKGDNSEINSKDQVELFEIITNLSINDTIKSLAKKRYHLEDLEWHIVNSTDDTVLLNVGPERINENILTCIFKTDVVDFLADDEQVQAYGGQVKNAPAYMPKVKELCLAKTKDEEGKDAWYRAQYQQELIEEKAQVNLFDYGRILKVRANNIRAFPECLSFKVTSFMGRLKSFDKLSHEEVKIYTEPFVAKSIEYDGDVHILTV